MKKQTKRTPRLYIISGMSGAGKSQALKAFEDFGFYCVDNLPMALLGPFADLLERSPAMERVALGMDVREGSFLKGFSSSMKLLRARGLNARVIFLDASDQVLVARYSETRHRHPLGKTVQEGVAMERRQLAEVKQSADDVIDTSRFTLGELKDAISRTLQLTQSREMLLTVTSFGFKHGLPIDADLVMDVRFLPNPNYVPELKHKTGLDTGVRRYLQRRGAGEFLAGWIRMIKGLLPRYVKEGKSHLMIAVGCTGGRHRSVFIAHEVAKALEKAGYPVREFHRDSHK
jgi:RNase adapter protein RapZ